MIATTGYRLEAMTTGSMDGSKTVIFASCPQAIAVMGAAARDTRSTRLRRSILSRL